MSMMNANAPLPLGALTIHRAVCAAENGLDALKTWNRRRRAAHQIAKLSRAQLIDIGLDGWDVSDLTARRRR